MLNKFSPLSSHCQPVTDLYSKSIRNHSNSLQFLRICLHSWSLFWCIYILENKFLWHHLLDVYEELEINTIYSIIITSILYIIFLLWYYFSHLIFRKSQVLAMFCLNKIYQVNWKAQFGRYGSWTHLFHLYSRSIPSHI